MKPMTYKPIEFKKYKGKDVKVAEILYTGTIDGYEFNIVSLGSHPTAYVKIPKTHPLYAADYNDSLCRNIDVHGGLTFGELGDYGGLFTHGYWIGWDYAHAYDYTEFRKDYNDPCAQKYTTEEIFKDVQSVICQLKELED